MISVDEKYQLSFEAIDTVSEEVQKICQAEKVQKSDAIQLRLAVEESLLNWQERFGNGNEVTLSTHQLLFRRTLVLRCQSGESFNPYLQQEGENSELSRSILGYIKIIPDFSYRFGWNTLTFKLRRKPINPLITLVCIILCSLVFGLLGQMIIPSNILTIINEGFLAPTYEKFLGLLSYIAGPMIFLSVAWGIYGMGDTATLNRIGKGLVGRLLLGVFIACICCGPLFLLFGCVISSGTADFSQVSVIYEMILDMIPQNIVSPFLDGNILQIIVMAVVVGICLLYLTTKTRSVANAIGQLNSLVSFLMELISKVVPLFIAVVMVNLIWSGGIAELTQSWKFIIILIGGLIVEMMVFTLYTAVKQKVSPLVLIRKAFPAYLTALTTASSAAAFGVMTQSCEKQFGIQREFVSFGIPVGIVLQKIGSAINLMLIVYYIASVYEVSLSPTLIVMAVIVSAITAVATPSIPGGGAIAYTALFTQMGLPLEGLSIALALDMLTDFLITSADIYCLQISLVNIAAHFGLLDHNRCATKI